ncbi:MAG: hypothetical protein OEW11_11150 [Nitrospirota bacterium]|nr:hypothetical protein [Nitrospirota bacterium]
MTTHLTHLTLTTGHTRQSPHAEVSPEVEAVLAPWLRGLIASGQSQPLPGILPGLLPDLLAYDATATAAGDALLLTISAGDAPLVTIAVVCTEASGALMWAALCDIFGPWIKPGLQRPATAPWCAVALMPGLAAHPDAATWLGDFGRCIAWTHYLTHKDTTK